MKKVINDFGQMFKKIFWNQSFVGIFVIYMSIYIYGRVETVSTEMFIQAILIGIGAFLINKDKN